MHSLARSTYRAQKASNGVASDMMAAGATAKMQEHCCPARHGRAHWALLGFRVRLADQACISAGALQRHSEQSCCG